MVRPTNDDLAITAMAVAALVGMLVEWVSPGALLYATGSVFVLLIVVFAVTFAEDEAQWPCK